MKIYDGNNLITNYDKFTHKLIVKDEYIDTYKKLVDIPAEYVGRDCIIRLDNNGYNVYERYGVIIPYTEEEKKDLEDKETERLIAERYSVKQELAILRQKETKPEEFAEFYAFVEECKAKAKALYKGD